MIFQGKRILSRFLWSLFGGLILFSCTKLELERVELVRVGTPVYNATSQSIEIKGQIIDEGEDTNISYGHVWSFAPNPKMESNNFTNFSFDTNASQNFNSTITELEGLRTYYFRSYLLKANNEIIFSETVTYFTPIDLFMKFVFVEGGEFMMGADSTDTFADGDEFPKVRTTVSDFYMAEFETPQFFWDALVNFNPSNRKGCERCPVTNLLWSEIQDFTSLLNQLTGEIYRLPTEAEWEYAAKGGNKSNGYIYSGSSDMDLIGWNLMNSDSVTHEVGEKMPNELGLYDMSGNVMEVCEDWYSFDYYKDPNRPANNPKGPETGFNRLTRGGAFYFEEQSARVTNRVGNSVDGPNRFFTVGFRLVREP